MPVPRYAGIIAATWNQSWAIDDNVYCCKFTANMSVRATRIGALVVGRDYDSSLFAVYDHDSGNDRPNNLLGQTLAYIMPGSPFPEWSEYPLLTPVRLERGTIYWWAFACDRTVGDDLNGEGQTFSGNTKHVVKTFTGTLPDPYGVEDTSFTRQYPVMAMLDDRSRVALPVGRNKGVYP